jgi:soluble lytic murein transglycosylase
MRNKTHKKAMQTMRLLSIKKLCGGSKLLSAIAVISLFAFNPANAAGENSATPNDQQNQAPELYKKTLIAIRKGHRTNTNNGLAALKDYPLYPYLLSAELQKRLKTLPYGDVDQFLASYQGTAAVKKLHQEWLFTLAKKNRWQDYNRYFNSAVAGQQLNCLRLESLHQTGYSDIALDLTADIWLTGKSQPDVCDNAFQRWEQAGLKTDELVWKRIQLALENNNTLLARYLSKRASAALKPYSRRLIDTHRNPKRLSTPADFNDGSSYSTDIISHGLIMLAKQDFQLADQLWANYQGHIQFSIQQNNTIRDKIARQIIASGDPKALDWLIAHDPNAEDEYLLEWRIRLALKQQKWAQAENWIAILPETLQQAPRWRYWLARSYQMQDKNQTESLVLLQQLARERNYYGFLAADITDLKYDFNHASLNAAFTSEELSQQPAFARAHEFYQLEELTNARREWLQAISQIEPAKLSAATELAHSWGWHQQAILTTIKANQWDDLDIRFPLAYQSSMIDSAKSATIRPEWLYAIARQESAFASDARSSADARGLLQLTPGTAKQVAQNIGVQFSLNDLYRAEKNIVLGSSYLKQLLADFEGNHILATAAYNAGPYRVKKWLKQQTNSLPYDIWIETLPYHETRNYVQNVLAFSVIYGHRLGLDASLNPSLTKNQNLMIGTQNN